MVPLLGPLLALLLQRLLVKAEEKVQAARLRTWKLLVAAAPPDALAAAARAPLPWGFDVDATDVGGGGHLGRGPQVPLLQALLTLGELEPARPWTHS